MGECKFSKSWVGRCKKETVEGSDYCSEHLLNPDNKGYNPTQCCQCGEQATHDCGETFQFVCGSPLCDKEECKIKHHPTHHRLTAKRWAELYKTEVPESLSGSLDNIEYKTFRTHLLREPVKHVTEAIQNQLEGHTIDGVEDIFGFGDVLYINFSNGMSVRFKADLE